MKFYSFLTHINQVINQITHGNFFGKLTIAAGALLTAFYTPIVGLIVACFVTTIVDLIYGLRVARKFKQKLESKRTWRGTIAKMMDEFTIISLARLIEYTILDMGGVFVLTGGVTVIVTLTELWSIIENLNTLDPTGPWRVLGKFLKKKGEDYIGFSIDLNKDDTDDENDSVDHESSSAAD